MTASALSLIESFDTRGARVGTGPVTQRGSVPDADDAMIAGCLAGDQASWSAMLRRYERDVARQMWRFSRDPLVCEELVQEVFVQVFRSLPRYRAEGTPFVHWLRTIATRVGYQFWKRQARRRPHAPLEGIDPAARESDAMDPSEAAELLHRLLAQLAPADRLVLTLHYLEDCDTREIAQRTGWNRAAVKMRLWRARAKLRNLIEETTRGLLPQGSSHGT
jgi:RNA polymerase sigma-70 factor (ECF subfamily)